MDKSNSKKLRKSEIKIPFLKKPFTALDLIKTLRRLIQFLPEELALLFPERVYKFKLTDLSIYWGFSSRYLANLKYMYKKKPKRFKVDRKKIDDLELIIKKRLGVKSIICLSIFKKYREGQINFWEFIERLRLELGRVSGEVEVTIEELNEILGFLVDDLIQRMTNPNKEFYNPNYQFSVEKLDKMLINIEAIFGSKAKSVVKLIDNYKLQNPNLKEYSLQQHAVKKPHYFKLIETGQIEKVYLFGFMGADGYIESNGWGIGIAVNREDREILLKFKEVLGVENAIKPRTIIKKYKNEIKKYYQLRLRFGCKPMWDDLTNLEFSSSKELRKKVPNAIKTLIKKARAEQGLKWHETTAGQTALAWLLGFYDGDGSYNSDGGDYGVLYSASEQFLEDIKEIFGFRHKVKEKEKPGGLVYIFDETRISKGYYYLIIDRTPIDLFSLMINSYSHSLKRKRPSDHAINQYVIYKKPSKFKKKKENKTQRNNQTNLNSEYPNAYINTEYPNPLIDQSEDEEEDLNEAWLWQSKQVQDDHQEMINNY